MTSADGAAHRRRTALRAALAMTVTLSLFALAGSWLLGFFGISLGALRVAGGLLLFLLATDLLRAQPSRQRSTPEEEQEGHDKPDVSLFPLAIPMLSGPGSFATVMLLMARARSVEERLVVLAVIAVVGLLTAATLLGSTLVERHLSRTGLNVLHRVMGLLLAGIAVQFVADGARELFPALGVVSAA
jgi:multiple antibiotic resistance protein